MRKQLSKEQLESKTVTTSDSTQMKELLEKFNVTEEQLEDFFLEHYGESDDLVVYNEQGLSLTKEEFMVFIGRLDKDELISSIENQGSTAVPVGDDVLVIPDEVCLKLCVHRDGCVAKKPGEKGCVLYGLSDTFAGIDEDFLRNFYKANKFSNKNIIKE